MALRAVIDHPKFNRLKALLKLNRACTLGYLEALWHFTGRFAPDGNIGKYEVEEIEAWTEWDGEEGALMAAFIDSGFIDDDPAGLRVHDWTDHQPTRKKRRWARLRAAGGEISRMIRYEIFARDGWACLHCGKQYDLTIDHIKPISKEGSNDVANLQTLCRSCNGRKRDQ